jgi:hypothetical protein
MAENPQTPQNIPTAAELYELIDETIKVNPAATDLTKTRGTTHRTLLKSIVDFITAQMEAGAGTVLTADVVAALAGTQGSPSSINRFVTNDGVTEIVTTLQGYIDTATVQDIQFSLNGNTLTLAFYTYQNALLNAFDVELPANLLAKPFLALTGTGTVGYDDIEQALNANEAIIILNVASYEIPKDLTINYPVKIFGNGGAINASSQLQVNVGPIEFHNISLSNSIQFNGVVAHFYNTKCNSIQARESDFYLYAGAEFKSTNGDYASTGSPTNVTLHPGAIFDTTTGSPDENTGYNVVLPVGDFVSKLGDTINGDLILGDGVTEATPIKLRFGDIPNGSVNYEMFSEDDLVIQDANGYIIFRANTSAINFECPATSVYTLNLQPYGGGTSQGVVQMSASQNELQLYVNNTGKFRFYGTAADSNSMVSFESDKNTFYKPLWNRGTTANFDTAWNNAGAGSEIMPTRRKVEEMTSGLYTVNPTIRAAVAAGAFTNGEFQGTQPSGTVLGMKFVDTNYRYEAMMDAANTTVRWIRCAKV